MINLYGLPETCTSDVEVILKNSNTKFCVKHDYCDLQITSNTKVIICVKNPYNWLISARNMFNKDLSLMDYINSEKTFDFDPYDKINPIDAYNNINGHWLLDLEVRAHQVQIVQYEKLQYYKPKIMKELSDKFGIKFTESTEITYNPLDYMFEYTTEILNIVNSKLDLSVIEAGGYGLY